MTNRAFTDKSSITQQCNEIRTKIIDVVSRQGGHLASSLGTVELCVALHKCFNLNDDDAVFFDVGHQAYAHKLLSGRTESFEHLRETGACSGFPSPEESHSDPVFAGHAGVALAQAIGAVKALELQHKKGRCIAVVGDGSLGCGIFWEALNNVGPHDGRLIIILNDNQMSISPSCGILRKILNRMIMGRFYNRVRANMSERQSGFFTNTLRRIERMLKSIFFPKASIFQDFGLRYLGPIDGNDVNELCKVLENLPTDKPILLHIVTQKGMGYKPAEEDPEKYHCLPPQTNNAPTNTSAPSVSFSNAFGNAMTSLAEKHSDVIAISAAMLSGTGLKKFHKAFPDRCFDVGMAEEYAVSYASGLAAKGAHPVVALYSTFLQRALDNVYHDVCLNNLPVIFCIDRTGTVPDGPTHHGIYALPFLRQMPNLTLMTPADETEMAAMLDFAYSLNAPVLLRYPRGTCPQLHGTEAPIVLGKGVVLRDDPQAKLTIWAMGTELKRAFELAELIERKNPDAHLRIVNPRFITPFDNALVRQFAKATHVVLDDYTPDGLAKSVRDALFDCPEHGPLMTFTWPANEIVTHGSIESIRKLHHLTIEDIADEITKKNISPI